MCINVSPTHVSQYYNTTTHELMLVLSSCKVKTDLEMFLSMWGM